MSYYHLFRITNDEDPKFNDAGWSLEKVDKPTQKDLERRNIYQAKYIHRYFIPDELGKETLIRKGNSNPSEWKNSVGNELEPLSSLKPNIIPDIAPGEFYPEVYEIKFPESFDPKDYYVKQEYPKVLKADFDDIVFDKPKTLEMGQKLREIFKEKDEGSLPIS